jgi:hypothetical protein
LRKLDLPTIAVKDTLAACVDGVSSVNLKQRIRAVEPALLAAEKNYLEQGKNGELYSIPIAEDVAGQVSGDEMKALYTQYLVPEKKPGRDFYIKLKSAPKHSICPLCGQRVVSTLDHYLAKAKHPALTITPANLVPACADCNKIKLAAQATQASEQTLHPYFDNVEGEPWLKATVVETAPPAVQFFAETPNTWDAVLRQRVQTHFDDFELASLYGTQAAVELTNIAGSLVDLKATCGSDAVREHLLSQAASRRRVHLNSWQTALYAALADSAWFCDSGVDLILL